MMDLVMALHCHQPVGNFDVVFERAHDQCYRPILDLLAAHPNVRSGIHFSGPLLEWLEDHKPDALDLLGELIQRGQVEPLSGGFYEPLLATIPQSDARGQILMMNDYLLKRFGYKPRGFWLTERIWDPSLPLTLAGTDMRYTVVDDTHFYYAGLNHDEIFGRYVTEREGHTLSLLATPMIMRYMIPFKQVDEVIWHLRSWEDAGKKVAVYGDDGEKFGLWPGTHEWVIQKGWLDRFFTLIEENSSWLRTVTPGDFVSGSAPLGRLYLPQASYEEMTEWALPSHKGEALEDVIQTLKNENRWDAWRPFVRGGVWDNFLVKYDETNRMHKKMLFMSARSADNEAARNHVWKAQCNCAYWHGVFGGLYLGHLRRAIHENLILARKLLNNGSGGIELLRFDHDKDGLDEVVVLTPNLGLGFNPSPGGSLFDISHLGRVINLSDTLTRRHEAYHRQLRALAERQGGGQDFASIHDQVRAKEEGLDRYLVYDPYTRTSLLDHFFDVLPAPENLFDCRANELGDFRQALYRIVRTQSSADEALVELAHDGHVSGRPLSLTKTVKVGLDSRIKAAYTFANTGQETIEAVYASEFNLMLYSDQDEKRFLMVPETGRRREVYETGREDNLSRFDLVNGGDGLKASFTFDRPISLAFFPLMTVSMSEEGFEKTYQGTNLHFFLPLRLEPGQKGSFEFSLDLVEI